MPDEKPLAEVISKLFRQGQQRTTKEPNMPTIARNLVQEAPRRPVPATENLEARNVFAVLPSFGQVMVCGYAKLQQPISREEALNLAVRLVALAAPDFATDGSEFRQMVHDIQKQRA